jgi:Ca2+-binding RTX toxin-like protein
MTTNDLPGCPKGGLLSGTDDKDFLDGKKGADEIHGLGASDYIAGGSGSDVIYGGPGGCCVSTLWGGEGDDVIYGGDGIDNLEGDAGEDVLHGGDGNDEVFATSLVPEDDDGQRDKLYCGPGKDTYVAGKLDYVDSSCEVKWKKGFGGGLA